MHINLKERLDRITAIDQGGLFYLKRNGLYEATEHEYGKSCPESKIDHPDIPGSI